MNSTSSAWLREQWDQSSSKWAVPEKSHSQRRPSGRDRTSLIFNAYTQCMKGDAQWLLSKPGHQAGGEVTDVGHWQAEHVGSGSQGNRDAAACMEGEHFLGKWRKSGKDTGGKADMQHNLCVTLQGDEGEDSTCRLKNGPALLPQSVLNRKIICPLLVSEF